MKGKSKEPAKRTAAPPKPTEQPRAAAKDGRPLTIVGIGTSAGGLAALKSFFSQVPAQTGVAFVVVVHLSPDHESHLADLLQPHCHMPVRQVNETMEIKPDCVYVIPPGTNLNTIDTHLRLTQIEADRRERAPIDHFFRTLADTHDGRSIGIILTGTGSDGTMGLRRIKESGGLTVVQDPAEAEYDGMPTSALESGMVDLVLPLEEIPGEVIRFAQSRPQVATDSAELEEDQRRLLQKIFAQIRGRTGHDFSQYKRSTILRRIERRMQLHHVNSLADYLEVLRGRPEESTDLFNDLLITVTEFFRDRNVYEVIEKMVVPRLFQGKTSESRLRVWSVGCSTGEEAYSLAMLLIEHASRSDIHPHIQIFASDLHEKSLARARSGLYPEEIAHDVSPERLRRFFSREGNHYRIHREVREMVVFAPQNLLRDPPFSHLDLVVCRNVLIYLQRDVQQDVLRLFHYSLDPNGLLLLGTSETVDRTELFACEHKEASLYRRRELQRNEARLPAFPLASAGPPANATPSVIDRIERASSYGAVHERMVERYAPPSVLVNEMHEIMHSSARSGRYLQMPGGEPTNNLVKLVREPLRIELRSVLYAARQSRERITGRPVTMRIDDREVRVVLRAQASSDPDMDGFTLVLFDEQPIEAPTAENGPPHEPSASVKELESELEITRQRLETVIEEYESSREEMQASNEELQSANEELRSTMEELETSKEELQSMNEELVTLNQENRHRVEELSQLSDDLQNLLSATEIATLFLDRELRIVRFTPQVGELFNIRVSDRGRPLTDITHHLGYQDLQGDALRVLTRLLPIEREVCSETGRWYLTRLMPYRTSGDRIDGIVITLIDITDRRRAEKALKSLNETLEKRVSERTALATRRMQDLEQLAALLDRAKQDERARLASLLHGGLQQVLVAAQLRLSHLHLDDPQRLREDMDKVHQLVTESISMSRDLAHELSPPVLYSGRLLDSLKWLAGHFFEKHHLNMEIDAPEALPDCPDHLRTFLFDAVRELLLNVVKHSGADHATLTVSAQENELAIDVADGGSQFDVDRVREQMQRPSGYGLFSIQERLKMIDGRMEVIRTKGGGGRFRLVVPLPHQQRPAGAPARTRRREQDPALRRPAPQPIKLLVVDDHQVVRAALVRLLDERDGLSVIGEAARGDEAVRLASALNPDLIVMDLDLPHMNGVEATRRILEARPETVIVGLSQHQDAAIVHAMLDAGAVAYLSKDIAEDELVSAITGSFDPPAGEA